MPLNLIMLGAPGAGKGTQAERLAARRGIPKISTGDMLREAVQAGTQIGLGAKAIMDRGELVSDDVMIGIVQERLSRPDTRPGFILDGFPRTVDQATALDGIITGQSPLVVVVDIDVPEVELVRRLTTRLVCRTCTATPEPVDGRPPTVCARCGGELVQRSDDSESVVRERLKVYAVKTKPLVDYYRARPTFYSIDGAQDAGRVAADIEAAVTEALRASLGETTR
jgi:adenylate kinase